MSNELPSWSFSCTNDNRLGASASAVFVHSLNGASTIDFLYNKIKPVAIMRLLVDCVYYCILC